jgi:predicted PurR-regulated permease PerM
MTALVVVVVWALFLARTALLLIYVSGVLAIGFGPAVRLIEKQRLLPVGSRRFPRWLAILTIYFIILGSLTVVGMMVLPPLVDQARDLGQRLPEMLDRAQTWLINKGVLTHRITLREAVEQAPGSPGDTVGTVVGAVTGVVGGIFGLVTILILTFYLLVESDNLYRTFKRMFPVEHRDRASVIARDISIKVSAWLNGQLILAATIGASAALGLWLLGVPYFYVLALIAAIGEMIPVVGPILSAVPAVLVALTVSPQKALAVIIFFFVQQQFENHVLVPKIMERQVGISAAFVIIALLFGGSLLGILGAILAVPTAAIIQVLFQELYANEERHP